MRATPMLRLPFIALLCLGCAGAAALPGQLGRSDLLAPGYLISTCGGFADSTAAVTGDRVPFPGGSDCHSEMATVAGGQVQSSAFFTAAPVATAIASGSAGFGFIKARAGFTGPNSAEFPRGTATGGWMDTWLIDAPGLAGTPGVLSFRLDVDGLLHAEPGGGVQFAIIAFRDDQRPTTAPRARWGGTGIFGRPPYDEVVDEMVTMSVSFTFGVEFDLAVFARAEAGTGSRFGSQVQSSGYSLFSDTLRWGGIAGVSSGGAAVDYTLSSASGVDWRQPFSHAALPEPPPAALALAALALLAGRFRARG